MRTYQVYYIPKQDRLQGERDEQIEQHSLLGKRPPTVNRTSPTSETKLPRALPLQQCKQRAPKTYHTTPLVSTYSRSRNIPYHSRSVNKLFCNGPVHHTALSASRNLQRATAPHHQRGRPDHTRPEQHGQQQQAPHCQPLNQGQSHPA